MKIWILREDCNEYDQPPNNLAAVWTKKPDVSLISFAMGLPTKIEELSQEQLIAVVSILKGEGVRFCNADFKLESVEEGKL